MTQASLSSLTLATIENYRVAANQAAHAYRFGGHRLIGALNNGLAHNVDPRTNKVAPQLTSTMVQMRGRITDIAIKGIDQLTARTEKAVEVGYDGAAKQVRKVAAFADSIDTEIVANGLQAAARLSMPVAKVALTVSGKVAQGAKALSTSAQGKSVTKAAKTAVKAVSQRATSAKRQVVKATRTTAKTVRATAAAPKKAVVRAKRKLA